MKIARRAVTPAAVPDRRSCAARIGASLTVTGATNERRGRKAAKNA